MTVFQLKPMMTRAILPRFPNSSSMGGPTPPVVSLGGAGFDNPEWISRKKNQKNRANLKENKYYNEFSFYTVYKFLSFICTGAIIQNVWRQCSISRIWIVKKSWKHGKSNWKGNNLWTLKSSFYLNYCLSNPAPISSSLFPFSCPLERVTRDEEEEEEERKSPIAAQKVESHTHTHTRATCVQLGSSR